MIKTVRQFSERRLIAITLALIGFSFILREQILREALGILSLAGACYLYFYKKKK